MALAAAPKPKIAWSPCHRDLGPFECGTVQVPLDYDTQSGTISLSLVRLPATDPSRRIGSLFLNPGGPGGSGVDFTLFAGPFLYTDEVRARFDLVGFDPRGIIRSSAFRCFGTDKQWDPYFTPFAFPSNAQEEAVWIAADHYLDDACAQRGGRIGEHMSTANVARDLDVLREAVGDDMLTYAGYSYGSFLGTTYANMFPGKVRALVVDGVLDPIAWTTGAPGQSGVPFSTRLRSDAGAMATLTEFFRLCDAGDCAFGPDSADRFADLAAQLKADPNPIDYSGLIGMTLGAMYDSSSWEDFAQVAGRPRVGRRIGDAERAHPSVPAPPAVHREAWLPALSELRRRLPGRGMRRQRQPRLVLGLVGRRCRSRCLVRLLRTYLDLGVEHLRGLGDRRHRSLPRAI